MTMKKNNERLTKSVIITKSIHNKLLDMKRDMRFHNYYQVIEYLIENQSTLEFLDEHETLKNSNSVNRQLAESRMYAMETLFDIIKEQGVTEIDINRFDVENHPLPEGFKSSLKARGIVLIEKIPIEQETLAEDEKINE